MAKPNPLLEKSYAFSVKIVLFCRQLQETKKEYILTKQLIRSGTSVGANIEEAEEAVTKPDFIHKLSISLKEAHEARYWLRLLRDTKITNAESTDILISDAHEIIRILVAILKTAKSR